MTRHVYPRTALFSDYTRAAAGFFPTIAVLVMAPVGPIGAIIIGGFAALFGVFGVRTALRHCTVLDATEVALEASGLLRASIPWSELDRMRLAYYSTRRDGRGGWMQLELRAGGSTLRVDSRIEGFSELVRVSTDAAKRRGLLLDPITLGNLRAVGTDLHGEPASRLGEAARGAA
jgi:hypothetical protein